MKFLDAAYAILKSLGQPLHYTEIAKRALDQAMLETIGQTPEATMGSRLYVDTKRANSRFRRVSRGVFALTEDQPSDIAQRIQAINRQTREELRRHLLVMPPDRFEALIGELLLALGFAEETVEVTAFSNDGGVDVRGVLNAAGITNVNAAVQAKRWKRNIQAPAVQALRGSLTVHEQGIFITTSKFSKGAQAEANAPGKAPISLIDGEMLLDLLIEHRIGVSAEQSTIYSLDEDWWGDIIEDRTAPITLADEPDHPVAYPLAIRAMSHGQEFRAELLDTKGRVRYNGTEYRSPSGAGKAVTGWKAVDGWRFWRFQHPAIEGWCLIDHLRLDQRNGK